MGLTAIELTGLLLVVLIGLVFLLDGGGDPGRALDFKAGEAVPLAILGGASLAFFALIGFEDSVNVAEECHEPSRAYPTALFAGLLIAGGIYMLVTIVASMAVETSSLVESDGPLLEVVQLGPLAINTKVFSAIALFALTNGALINLIMASRLVYGMAQQGIVPRQLGRVHRDRRTPWVAIIFTTALAVFLIIVGDLETLANTTVLLLLAVFVCVNIAVLILRRQPWSIATSTRRRCCRSSAWAAASRSSSTSSSTTRPPSPTPAACSSSAPSCGRSRTPSPGRRRRSIPRSSSTESEPARPGLLDQVVTEGVMGSGVHEIEAGALVQAPRVVQDVVGPQDDLLVARAAREAQALVDQPRADAAPARPRLDEQQAQLSDRVALGHAQDAPGRLAVDLGDPRGVAPRV